MEYRAIHSYHSEAQGDLQFSEGDTVLVYWGQDNGWWYGTTVAGTLGWFPESYVEVRPRVERDAGLYIQATCSIVSVPKSILE